MPQRLVNPDDLGDLLQKIAALEGRDLAQAWVAALIRLGECGEPDYLTLGAVIASMLSGGRLEEGLTAFSDAVAHARGLMRDDG